MSLPPSTFSPSPPKESPHEHQHIPQSQRIQSQRIQSQRLDKKPIAEKPKSYFLYGTLSDPSTLQSVLSCSDRPVLRPARLEGYKMQMWGAYPALIPPSPPPSIATDADEGEAHDIVGAKDVVGGVLFEPSEFEHAGNVHERSHAYEGANYERTTCLVDVKGQTTKVCANTFVWVGDTNELTETRECGFDLREWQMRRLEREIYSSR